MRRARPPERIHGAPPPGHRVRTALREGKGETISQTSLAGGGKALRATMASG